MMNGARATKGRKWRGVKREDVKRNAYCVLRITHHVLPDTWHL